MGYFLVWVKIKNSFLSTYVRLFSIVPSILTFDFDLILGSFLTFWAPNRVGVGFKNVFGSPTID